MWLSNEKRRKRRRSFAHGDGSRDPLLMVNARAADKKQMRSHRIGAAVIVLGVAAGALAATGFAFLKAGEVMFSSNPRYTLKTLDIRSDGKIVTPELVREWTGLRTGTNLFAVDIGRMREDILAKAPMVKSMEVTRRLPDALDIRIAERLPIARLGSGAFLGVDKEGFVFNLKSPASMLPAIVGYRGAMPYPGSSIRGNVLRALELLDLCMRSPAGQSIRIDMVDVSDENYLVLHLGGGESVRLSAQAASPSAGRPDMEHKLLLLTRTLQKSAERGKRIAWVDLTYGDDYIPAQEY